MYLLKNLERKGHKMNTYGIQLQNGQFKKVEGNNMAEALKETFSEKKTSTGEIDFSLLNFICLIPAPMNLEETEKRFQLYLMRDKKSNWKECGEPTNNLSRLQELLDLKLKLEGNFSAVILDLFTDKVVDWKWTR